MNQRLVEHYQEIDKTAKLSEPFCLASRVHFVLHPLKYLVCLFVYLALVSIRPIQWCFGIHSDVKHAHLIYYLVIFALCNKAYF